MREVRICDVTMKLAAASKQLDLTFKEKLEVAKLLDSLDVSAIEIEGIERPKADALRIKSIASRVKNSVVAVPVKMDAENIEQVWNAVKGAKHPRLQVEAPLSPARMEYLLHKKAEGMLDDITATVARCVELCDDVEFIADDATRTDPAYLKSAIEAAIDAGAKTVTVGDVAGKMLPGELAQFIEDLRASIDRISEVTLGVSCSNDLFMANACTMASIEAGAQEIKTNAYPLGVAALESVAKIISVKGDACQVHAPVRTTAISRTVSQIARICEQGRAKNSTSGLGMGESDEDILLTVNDDMEAVVGCVQKLGYDLSEEDAEEVYQAFVRIASKKDSIGARELDAIVASAALQVPATYVLESYVINSGNVIKATANIRMRKDGELLEAVCIGDGPIDASFMAIEQIVGKRYELDDWQMASVTEGQEAMGEAVVKLIADGKIYSGRGISTDIVGSSIRAYVNALNKIVYEEQN